MKKLIIALIEAIIIIAVVAGCVFGVQSIGFSEEMTEAWVVCQPNDYVNIRNAPSRKSESVGRLDGGDSITVYGKVKNGFIRCAGVFDSDEAWVFAGYLVYEEPERMECRAYSTSRAKLASRKWIGGKVRKWLKNLDDVIVYWWTDDWCVTNKGFVQSKYLEIEGY